MSSSQSAQVLHYLDEVDLTAGGVVRAVIDLCNVLSLHDCEVTLATYDDKDVPLEWSERPNAPRVINISHKSREFESALANTAVAHLHTLWDPKNLPIARNLRRRGTPYIVSVHGMLDDWCVEQKALKKRVFHWFFGKRLLEEAYRVHCTAEGEKQQASKWYPNGVSAVIPLVVDMPSLEELPGPELALNAFPWMKSQDAQLLFLSRIHPKKGIDILIRALAILVNSGSIAQLNIAGPGEKSYIDELKNLAKCLGVADRTHFVGLVQGEIKRSIYQAADLFVLSTHQENFGLVLPEALACGTPVVTTKGVDIWPEIEAAGGAIVENQPETLAEKIASLLADRSSLASLGTEGRDYVLKWLDPARVAQQFNDLYLQAANDPLINRNRWNLRPSILGI